MHRLIMLAPLLLSACAGETTGPSLAKRPIESNSMDEPVREVTAPAPASVALRTQIQGFVDQARDGQRAFSELLPRARSAAAAAGAEATESWIVAQQLLSALEGARAPSTRSLSALDALIATRLQAGDEAGLAELQTANAEVGALVESQQSALQSIRATITR